MQNKLLFFIIRFSRILGRRFIFIFIELESYNIRKLLFYCV